MGFRRGKESKSIALYLLGLKSTRAVVDDNGGVHYGIHAKKLSSIFKFARA